MTQEQKNIYLEDFAKHKVIVVCRGVTLEEIVHVAQAMYDGGIRFMEVPFIQHDPASFPLTAAKIKALKEAFADKMHVGAGTVLTMEQFQLAKEAGAEVIVSPCMDEQIIQAAKEAGLIMMPGCATPSEMVKAHQLGADYIKLFPASMTTLQTIKEIRVPLSHLELICFGGVNAQNITEVLATGVSGVGMASCVLDKTALTNKDYSKITQLAKAVTQQVK